MIEVSQQFVSQLFKNQYFTNQLNNFIVNNGQSQPKKSTENTIQFEIQTVIDEISQVMYNNFKFNLQKQFNHIYESNRHLLEEIQNIKVKLNFNFNDNLQEFNHHLNTETSTTFCDIDIQRYNKNKIETSVFFCQDEDDMIKDSRIQDSINRIEISLEEKLQKFTQKTQKVIEQFRKTIASIVQEMNQRNQWTHRNKEQQKDTQNQTYFVKKDKQLKQYSTTQKTQPKLNESSPKSVIKSRDQFSFTPITVPKSVHNNNKTINSLNKSFNFGRSKIKSLLFG